MRRLRRRSGAVYRVYGEEEYLAGADSLAAWDGSLAGEPKRGRSLQRLAGAAALTGAMGTVGGVVWLVGVRAHAVDRREIAERSVPSVRAAALRGHASAPARMARRQSPHPRSPRRMRVGRGIPTRVSSGPALGAERVLERTIARGAWQSTSASAPVASAAPGASTEAVSVAQGTPAETPSFARETPPATAEAQPAAQSEFGFER